MADIALGSVEKIVQVVLKIKETVETVRQNEEECNDIRVLVVTLSDTVSRLQNTEAMNHPTMDAALVGLEKTLHRALELVTNCKKRNAVCLCLGAGDMSKQLHRVQEDILRKMVLVNFATTAHLGITLTANARFEALRMQLFEGRLCANHSTTDDARSGLNDEVILAATGSDVPAYYMARPSKENVTEGSGHSLRFKRAGVRFGSSKRQPSARSGLNDEVKMAATGSDVPASSSMENVTEGSGHSLAYKFVIKVSMPTEKIRSKVMELVARTDGVKSTAITGDDMDQLELVGDGVDLMSLVRRLRRKVGHAEILRVVLPGAVEEAKEKQIEAGRGEELKVTHLPPC